jgi:hypothetical protein
VRAEVVVTVLVLSTSTLAQERRGGVFELGAPLISAPRAGATEIGEGVLAEGRARPLVEVVLFDADGRTLGVTTADADGHWAASVTMPAGPTELQARARFLTLVSEPAQVHFTVLRDDAVEGGGCAAASGLPLLLGAAWVLRRRAARALR